MWNKFSPNPHGSSVGDCAVRAVAAATGQSWEQAYIGLALTGFALGDMPSANRTWGAYLQKHGFKRLPRRTRRHTPQKQIRKASSWKRPAPRPLAA